MEPFKKPEIPTLKDSGKQPMLKIKGLAGGGLSFVDRLKQFKKKDLAFIFAGLGTLFMAPLAEHFMMSPDSAEQGAFKEGWNIRGDAAGFGTGQSPYEGGVSGLAPGSLLGGGGSDVITPLNVRDPSALIMGPGQSTPQPVTAPQAPPQSASPAKASGGDWKDALANAAGRGAKEAVKAASLPVPKIPLQGGLRGLGAVSGGGGGGYSLPAISASGVPNTAAGSNSLQKVGASPGYKGVAAARGSGPNTGGLEALKTAAAGAAGEMNRGGSAASNLDTAAAASQALPGGGADGGGGGGAQGGGDKAPGGNQDKSSKQQGESLEFLIAKENAMKQLELDWELKKKKAMMWPNMKEKMFETFMTKGIAEPVSKMFADFLTGDGHEKAKTFLCGTIIDKGVFPIPAGKVKPCGGGGVGKDDSSAEFCIDVKKDIYRGPGGGQENLKVGAGCWKSDGSTTDATPKPETKPAVVDVPGVGGIKGARSGLDIAGICAEILKDPAAPSGGGGAAVAGGIPVEVNQVRQGLKSLIANMNGANTYLYGKDIAPACGKDPAVPSNGTNATVMMDDIREKLAGKSGAAKTVQEALMLTKSALNVVSAGANANPPEKKDSAINGVEQAAKTLTDELAKKSDAGRDQAIALAPKAFDPTINKANEIITNGVDGGGGYQKKKDAAKALLEAAGAPLGQDAASGLIKDADDYVTKAGALLEKDNGDTVTGAVVRYKALVGKDSTADAGTAKRLEDWSSDVVDFRNKLLNGDGFSHKQNVEFMTRIKTAKKAIDEAHSTHVPQAFKTADGLINKGQAKPTGASSAEDLADWAKTNVSKTKLPSSFSGDATQKAQAEQEAKTATDGLNQNAKDLKASVDKARDEKTVLEKVNNSPAGMRWNKAGANTTQPWQIWETVPLDGEPKAGQ